MYKGRRVKKTARDQKRAGRNLMLLLAAVLLLGAATVGTMAYFTADDSSSSGFTIGKVKCEVSGPVNNVYTITNIGNVDAYIRVAVVANAVEGNVIQWETPVLDTDYKVTPSGCTYNSADGFWYSDNTVEANGGTISLTVSDVAEGVQVQVIAEAIQGQAAAANNAWTTHTY